MLQIQHICKEYRTANLVQKALDDVSLNLRDNEFVAILGPSGSGKTTLLNIIGGLDRYDSGDLVINGISTKKYKDRDWDSYRNHTIGFVFQNYNLIPHQTVLSNVELALTISGIGKEERRKRAIEALEQVGLGEQLHKKPNQMSGGQMQRVAIARALVNDPDILLADEPTGALDSETSVQVMDLLREVAKDRLVVMVTHNPELAQDYATRIVKLKDGKIRSDSDPYIPKQDEEKVPVHQNMGKSSMSFLTALALSFNNLKTKKARTLLTAFAGSIGIIGIALILALSTGVNDYIQSVEEDTLSEYPLQIQSTGFDISSMIVGMSGNDSDSDSAKDKKSTTNTKNKADQQVKIFKNVTEMFSKMNSNDLKSLKKYLDSDQSDVRKYTKSIEYSYNITPQIYRDTGKKIRKVNPDQSFSAMGLGSSVGTNSMMSSMMSTNVFYRMPNNPDLYKGQYNIKAGRWPQDYNECVLVLTPDGSMSDFLLYTLGLRNIKELDDMVQNFIDEKNIKMPGDIGKYTYRDIMNAKFKLVNASDYYQYDSKYKVWKDKSGNQSYLKKLMKNAEDIKIVGVVQPKKGGKAASLTPGINYPASLVQHTVQEAKNSKIVREQLKNKKKDIFTGEKFGKPDKKKGMDMNSMFAVDQDALKNAFGMDTSAFSGSMKNAFSGDSLNMQKLFENAGKSMDLSKMIDLDKIAMNLEDMPDLQLDDMVKNLQVAVKPGGMEKLSASLMLGYNEYVKTHPEADYSSLDSAFAAYLKTDSAQTILKTNMKAILKKQGKVTLTTERMQELVTDVLKGFQQYEKANNLTDPDKFSEYLQAYLKTDGAVSIMNTWADKVFADMDIQITDAEMDSLSSQLSAGYLVYAKKNNKPDPTKMGQYFLDYISTPDGQKYLAAGLTQAIDMDKLEKQISKSMGTYMKGAMGTYSKALSKTLQKQMTSAMKQITSQMTKGMQTAMTQAMSNIGTQLQDAMKIDPSAFAKAFNMNMSQDDLMELFMSMSGQEKATYEGNLQKLGYADFAKPSTISLYPKNFDAKAKVVDILDNYNKKMEKAGKDEQVITYTDIVGTMMNSVTDIINIISYVLIAFVAISLIVSSIMIGVITYISVLERKKEIGILRAIGASKGNVSQVFNAETFIIGLCAGLMGIGLTLLILVPANMVIHTLTNNTNINAVLPAVPALVLIVLSVVLTLLGGLIPSRKAAKSDPVTALRTE